MVFLRRFHHDWVTTTYLHRSFRNRRAYLKRGLDENGAGPSNSHHAGGDDDVDDVEIDDDLAQESDEDNFTDGSKDDDDKGLDEDEA